MKTYSVDTDNHITLAAPAADTDLRSGELFSTQAELAALADGWPTGRLVAVWNALPAATALKKFTDRKTAVSRIWKAVQGLLPDDSPVAPTVALTTRGAGNARGRNAKVPTEARAGSKTDRIILLLKRPSGATLADLMKATSWQPHTVRGFISGGLTKRMRIPVESTRREDGGRVYRILP